MFNPQPEVHSVAIGTLGRCVIIDQALSDPQAWVQRAQQFSDEFAQLEGNAFPGPELHLPAGVTQMLDGALSRHAREALHVGATLAAYSRLSMVLLAPEQLAPKQWICHRDQISTDPAHAIAASVLYLFQDPDLGGTSFYQPRDPARCAQLVHDSGVLDGPQFQARYGIAAGYLLDSNAHFERLLTVPARFNRLIFYSGRIFHSSHIPRPDLLARAPQRGRLTMNGFFVCEQARTTST
jgi:hypothetical protein